MGFHTIRIIECGIHFFVRGPIGLTAFPYCKEVILNAGYTFLGAGFLGREGLIWLASLTRLTSFGKSAGHQLFSLYSRLTD